MVFFCFRIHSFMYMSIYFSVMKKPRALKHAAEECSKAADYCHLLSCMKAAAF